MAVVAATALIGTGAFFSPKSFLLAEEKSKFTPRSDSGFNGQVRFPPRFFLFFSFLFLVVIVVVVVVG